MKRTGTIIASLMLGISLASAQIPNGGFENWTSGSPDNWFANNVPTYYSTITQSTTAHSGSYAAQGQVAAYFNQLVAPLMQTGSTANGFHYVGRPASVTGYYQLSSQSGDEMHVIALLVRGDTAIAAATGIITTAASSYTQFSFPFTYVFAGNADSAYVQIAMSNAGGTVHSGSVFLVDDIAFSGVNGVNQSPGTAPRTFALDQNYPNPFNPSTTIGYDVPYRSRVEITVFNALGQQVKQLVNDDFGAGHYTVQFNANGLASGVYFYRLRAVAGPDANGGQSKEFVQTKTLLLMK